MAKKLMISFLVMASLCASALMPAAAGDKRAKAERLVVNAAETARYFSNDRAFEAMWGLAKDAKGMVIVPQSIRAGFIFGGSAGDAVFVSRNEDGSWSQPVFMTVGSFSFGLQAGGEASEIVLLVMTNRGKEQLLSTSVKLGADLSVAAGPVGGGSKAQTTDILAFSRSRGLYGGISLEGAVLKIRHKMNDAYYSTDISPSDIIYRGNSYNPNSAVLQESVIALAQRHGAQHNVVPLQPAERSAAEDPQQYGREYRPLPQGGGTNNNNQQQPNNGAYEDDEAWGAPVK